MITTVYFSNKKEAVIYVSSLLASGVVDYASTITTRQGSYEGFYVDFVTGSLSEDTQTLNYS